MKAWVVSDITEGGSMSIRTVERPVSNEKQCVVKVEVAGANFLDVLMIRGSYQTKPPLPFTPGVEAVGTVVEAGPASRFKPGERIFALVGWGAFGEFLLVGDETAGRVPSGLSSLDALGLATVFPTAYLALCALGRMQKGETVLITAGAGGVGSSAIQLASYFGAHVIAAAGDDAKCSLCRQLGAHEVINYRQHSLVEELRSLTRGNGVDIAVDSVGGSVAIDCLRSLAWGGRLMIVGFAGGEIASLPTNRLLLRQAAAVGVLWGAYARRFPEKAEMIVSELITLQRSNSIKTLVRDIFPFERTDDALRALAMRQTVGKVGILFD